jgi:hypothetical protein
MMTSRGQTLCRAGRASVARGDVISGDEFFKRLETKLDTLPHHDADSSYEPTPT